MSDQILYLSIYLSIFVVMGLIFAYIKFVLPSQKKKKYGAEDLIKLGKVKLEYRKGSERNNREEVMDLTIFVTNDAFVFCRGQYLTHVVDVLYRDVYKIYVEHTWEGLKKVGLKANNQKWIDDAEKMRRDFERLGITSLSLIFGSRNDNKIVDIYLKNDMTEQQVKDIAHKLEEYI